MMKLRYTHVLATMSAALLTACGTPGIRSTVPPSKLQDAKKIVVVSAIGDKVQYHKQGFISGDHGELAIDSWGLDGLVTSRVTSAINKIPGVEAVPYNGSVANLAPLYSGIPGNGGLAFGKVREPLQKIIRDSSAGAAILIFKGGGQMPGAVGNYFVQGLIVTQVRGGGCGAFPYILIAIVDRDTLEPVATNRLAANFAPPPWIPEEICEKQLRNLDSAQDKILKETFVAEIGLERVQESIARLIEGGLR